MQYAFDRQLERLLAKDAGSLLVAVSGGVDSMSLLYLCAHSSLNLQISVAHMNFSLREGDCDLDQDLVRETAERYGLPFFTKKVDTLAFAAERGISVEMAARELRYGWFREVMEQNDIEFLVVGHNLNDRAETMMLNMLRGTGITGMHGMRAVSGTTIRPLLGLSREQISKFAAEHGIKYREDYTNSDTAFVRNKIRHEIFPRLAEINPSFLRTFESEMDRFAQIGGILDGVWIEKEAELCSTSDGIVSIDAEKLAAEPEKEYWLYRILAPYGFTSTQIADAAAATGAQSGKSFEAPGYRMIKTGRYFKIYPLSGKEFDGRIETEIFTPGAGFNPKVHDKDVLYADADTLTLPLYVRQWQPADRFWPLGAPGRQLVSDFFSDHKFDLEQKKRAGIICWQDGDGEHIAGIAACRIDNRHKVTASTKRVVAIKFIG